MDEPRGELQARARPAAAPARGHQRVSRQVREEELKARKRRLAVARFWFEGNAFSPLATDRAAFERREWARGEAALAGFLEANPAWQAAVLRCASANPGGPVEDGLFDALLEELAADLARDSWDAVYLSLHGAAITRLRAAPDLELVRAVREAARGAPVGASFDLHANLDPAMAGLLAVASGYRTYPHMGAASSDELQSRFLAFRSRLFRESDFAAGL